MRTTMLKKIALCITLLAAWLLPIEISTAKTPDSSGTSFHFAFPKNGTGNWSDLSLYISGQEDTSCLVEIPGINFSKTVAVKANEVSKLYLPYNAQWIPANQVSKLGVSVTAQKPVTVQGLNRQTYITDGFLALPAGSLGLEYIVTTYNGSWYEYPSQIAVVGVFDNTSVTIIPSTDAVGHPAGVPFTVILNSHDTYQINGSKTADFKSTDLTGSIITASAPVAVMGSSGCTNIPSGYDACNHLVEMMPPVTTWGKSFLTVPIASRLRGDLVRILAAQDDTQVYINGQFEIALKRGQFFDKTLTAKSHIETSRPALVAQYSYSQAYDNVLADPFMMLVPPVEQYLSRYTFSTYTLYDNRGAFINIITPTSGVSTLYLDGTPVNSSLFSPIGNSGYSGAQIPLAYGTSHTITGSMPFGANVYGLGQYDGYGYPAGMGLEIINPAGDTTAPHVSLTKVSDVFQGTATDQGAGIFKVELESNSTNANATVTSFIPGSKTVYFSVSALDPNNDGTGYVRVMDGSGNVTRTAFYLSKFALLQNVRVVDTVMTNGNEIDATSFTKQPYSVTMVGDRTVIEWRYDFFPVNLDDTLAFDVIMKGPVAEEQRLITQSLELLYTDVNGNPVRTALDPQYVNVYASVFAGTLTTDKAAYQANEIVTSAASVNNMSGYGRTIDANIVVEDSQGNKIQDLTSITGLTLAAGEVRSLGSFTFSTGSNFAGGYRTRLIISENQLQTYQAIAGFTIMPTITASASITTDKIAYSSNDMVTLGTTVTSWSTNYVFENLTAEIVIGDPAGTSQVYSESKRISSLMPGASHSFKTYWNTGIYPPGTYPVRIEVKDAGGALIAGNSRNLTISSPVNAAGALKGQISLDKQKLLTGETLTVSYSVANTGNLDLTSIPLSVITVHAADQNIYNTITGQANLVMGATFSATGIIETNGYTAKDYLVILRATINGNEETLAGTYFRVEGAPTEPSLAGPSNGSDTLTFTPSLAVNNASDPNDDKIGYEFEVYGDRNLTTLIASSGLVSEQTGSTNWLTPVLQENMTYYWRSRAYDGWLYSPWMTAASFRVNTVDDAPSAPGITSPADGTEISTYVPVLSVTNSTDPDSTALTYNFDVALDPGFTHVVTSVVGVASGQGMTSWQVPQSVLEENSWYYWRAQADDWFVSGPWSVARFFVNTSNEAPATPVIQSPADGTVVRALETDITAANSTDPDSAVVSYNFEADTTMTFDSPNIMRSGTLPQGQGTTTWHMSSLVENTQYYIRAKASDGQADSAWSAVVGFFVNSVNEAPTTPMPANPSNGSGVTVFAPTLSVHNAGDADRDPLTYDFEIYSDSSLATLITGTYGVQESDMITLWALDRALTENQVYYWRSRAYDGQITSAWTDAYSFMVNTANDAPKAPGMAGPAEGSSVSTLTPTLSITNATDPDSGSLTYAFEINSNGILVQSMTGIAEGASGTTSVNVQTPLADNTLYQWRVRAFDGQLYGPWTNMASFTVHIPVTSINATINFDPDTLNKASNGTWVVVYIELPAGYRPEDIDISSIRLEGTIPAEARPIAIGDHDKDGIRDLMVKFKRSEVINKLRSGDKVTVQVTGKVGSMTFEGVDIIRVID